MQTFHIRYRNTQGTLMRILNAASRRALDLPVVQAEPAEHDHQVTLALDVNQKQVGQLYREWYTSRMSSRSALARRTRTHGARRILLRQYRSKSRARRRGHSPSLD